MLAEWLGADECGFGWAISDECDGLGILTRITITNARGDQIEMGQNAPDALVREGYDRLEVRGLFVLNLRGKVAEMVGNRYWKFARVDAGCVARMLADDRLGFEFEEWPDELSRAIGK